MRKTHLDVGIPELCLHRGDPLDLLLAAPVLDLLELGDEAGHGGALGRGLGGVRGALLRRAEQRHVRLAQLGQLRVQTRVLRLEARLFLIGRGRGRKGRKKRRKKEEETKVGFKMWEIEEREKKNEVIFIEIKYEATRQKIGGPTNLFFDGELASFTESHLQLSTV